MDIDRSVEADLELVVRESRASYGNGQPQEFRNYRDLKVWQSAIELTEAVYRISAGFPIQEQYGLTAQIRTSVVSVPSNIAEGWGRNSDGDFNRFLSIASGSLREVETQLILSQKLGFTTLESIEPTLNLSDQIGRMIYRLQRSLKSRKKA